VAHVPGAVVKLGDALHDVVRETRRLGVLRDLEIAPPRVRHTADFDDLATDEVAIVASVGVGLQVAVPPREKLGGMLARTIRGELVEQ
jgi:hypothetical protein